jgi:hypothetical protein
MIVFPYTHFNYFMALMKGNIIHITMICQYIFSFVIEVEAGIIYG